MTETMWKIIYTLRQLYVKRGKEAGYLALWNIEDDLGIKLAGCGVPDGDTAIEQLVKLGLIEELPALGCRYRIVVRDGEK